MYIDSTEPAPGAAGKFVVVTEHVVPLYDLKRNIEIGSV
jgi:hypothetical protein